jgi:NAD(P)-dependent dehydrogenase (short-subunit alcohol dehydrogenase family)
LLFFPVAYNLKHRIYFKKGAYMKAEKTIRTFNGATAIVTGAASGIGRGLAIELAKRGSEVVLADLQGEKAERLAEEIKAAGGRASAAELDVSSFPDVEKLVREAADRTGRLDYMFNNAGIGIIGDASKYTIDDWNRIIRINLNGVVNGVQAAYQAMIKQGFGHIVNTSSLGGLVPQPGNVAYSATKHAIVGLSTSLRSEAAMLGVRVSVICPGFVRTDIFNRGGKFGKSVVNLSNDQQQRLLDSYEKYKPVSADIFAAKALDLVAKNRAIIVLPAKWRLVWLICRLFPSLSIEGAKKPFIEFKKIAG